MKSAMKGSGLARLVRIGFMLLVFAVVLAMSPATYDPTGPLKILILQWAAFVLGSLWFIGAWWLGKPLNVPRLFGPLWLLLFTLYVISTLFSTYAGHGLQEMARITALALLYVTAAQVYRTPAQIRAFMLATIVVVAISSFYGFVQKAGLDPFPLETPGDPLHLAMPGTFGNPNYAAHVLVLAIVFAIYLASRSRWCIGFAALFTVHLLFTGARGGVLALAFAVCLVGTTYFVSRRLKAPVRVAAVSLAVVALIGIVALTGAMAVVKARTGIPLPLDASLLLRYNSYYGASRMILDRPLLGFGPGTFEIENTPYWTPYEQQWFADKRMMNRHVHNDVLETAVDAGLPAAGLYLSFLACGLAAGLVMALRSTEPEKRRLGYAFAATFAAFTVDTAFGFNFRVPVSSALIMLVAGMMEGVWQPPVQCPKAGRRSWGSLAWRLGLVAIALGAAVYGTRIYMSKALVQLGRSARHSEIYGLARESLIKAERLNPFGWLAQRELGLTELAQGKPDAAIPHFERALKQNPYYVMTLLDLANAEIDMAVRGFSTRRTVTQEKDAAEKHLQASESVASKALELCPVCYEAEDYLGRAMSLRAIYEQGAVAGSKPTTAARETWIRAEVHAKRALRLGAPDRARLYGMIAQGRIALNDANAAEEALISASQFVSEAESSEAEIWNLFAKFAQTFKREAVLKETLLSHMTRLKSVQPPATEAIGRMYHRLARVQQSLGEPDDAIESSFRAATQRAPLTPSLWRDYALFAKATGRTDRFRSDVLTAAAALPKDEPKGASLHIMAQAWQPEGSPVRAAKSLENVVTARIKSSQSAGLVEEMGWVSDALLTELRSMPEPSPDRLQGLFATANALARLGQMELAAQIYGELAPSLPPAQGVLALFERGRILERLGRSSEAISVYRQGLVLAPENVNLRLSLARALRGTNAELARQSYQELLKSPSLTRDEREKVSQEMETLGSPPSRVP